MAGRTVRNRRAPLTCGVRKESKIEDELRQPGRKCGRKLGRADGKVVGIRKRRRLRKFRRHTYRSEGER